MKLRTLCAILTTAASAVVAMPFSNRVTTTTGQKIFVNGMNLAWLNFANDFGDNAINATALDQAMKNVSDSGANTMRIWISVYGSDFKYDASNHVVGMGSKTIQNLKTALSLAHKHNLLLIPTLMTHNLINTSGDQWNKNKLLLTDNAALTAYIGNYLVPLVTAIGKDPNLLCWEVFNEPEGLVYWSSSNKVQKTDVQRVVNRVAGAIHRAVPGVLVSNGSNQISYKDWYLDATLKAVGGDADGVLDFYMFHYYGWTGTGDSPFTQTAASLGLDKPVVIGEFASSSWSTKTMHPEVRPSSAQPLLDAMNIDSAMAILWSEGYAGGLYWQYSQDGDDPWMKGFVTAGHPLAAMRRAHKSDIDIIPWSDTGSTYSVLASAIGGGKIEGVPDTNVKSGTIVTLTAIPNSGFEFTGWSGDTTTAGSATKLVLTVKKSCLLTANFAPTKSPKVLQIGYDNDTAAVWSNIYKAGSIDLSARTNASVDVLVPKSATGSFKVHWVVKSGAAWQWDISDNYCLIPADSAWHTCTAELAKMHFYQDSTLAKLSDVHAMVLHFGTDSSFHGKVWFDNIRMDADTLYNFQDGNAVWAVDDYNANEAAKVSSGPEVVSIDGQGTQGPIGSKALQINYDNDTAAIWSSLKKDTTIDASAHTKLVVDVRIPKSSVGSFKMHWVVKSDTNWRWDVSDNYCTIPADSLVHTCEANLASMHYYADTSVKAKLSAIHSLVLNFGTDASFHGKVWFDNVRLDNDTIYTFENGKSVFEVDASNPSQAAKITAGPVVVDLDLPTSVMRRSVNGTNSLRVFRTSTGLEWSMDKAATTESVLQLIDLKGRVVARQPLQQGQLRGVWKGALPAGILIATVSESGLMSKVNSR